MAQTVFCDIDLQTLTTQNISQKMFVPNDLPWGVTYVFCSPKESDSFKKLPTKTQPTHLYSHLSLWSLFHLLCQSGRNCMHNNGFNNMYFFFLGNIKDCHPGYLHSSINVLNNPVFPSCAPLQSAVNKEAAPEGLATVTCTLYLRLTTVCHGLNS